uniref:IS5 family transposase n=1 Tax=Desulfogranum mediterraneum TaxID=160661 RepID=UPI00054F15E3
MIQPGFFDLQDRLHQIDKNGDPLSRLNEVIDWDLFRPAIEEVRNKKRKSNVGPKGYDAILLFKILILQSLYNLSDEATEYQILDRYSFGRFLGLHVSQKVPDATTIWRFREDLIEAGIIEQLFSTFDAHLRDSGFVAMKGQIVDASIINAPKQRNSRDENSQIKHGSIPDWPANKQRQKDVDARWTKKNGKTYYGYKNHISVDVKHKLIRSYCVTDAALHDSQVFEQLLT